MTSDSLIGRAYGAVRFCERTTDSVFSWIDSNNIPNPVNRTDLHCTVLYSETPCPTYVPRGLLLPQWVASPLSLEAWPTRIRLLNGMPTRCLVLLVDSEDINNHHSTLRRLHSTRHDFPTFQPHVTLSYDIGELDISRLGPVSTIGTMVAVEEYGD